MGLIIKMLIALALYDILGWGLVFILSLFPYKQWDRRMKNPPPPPKRSEQWIYAKHHGLYQPIDKVDTSNPPKETGT